MGKSKLDIHQNQMQTLIRAAHVEGAVIEVKLGNAFVKITPNSIVDGKEDIDNKKRPTL